MNWFKKQFSSKKNGVKKGALVLLVIVLLVCLGFLLKNITADNSNMFALVLSKVLVNFTNEDRKTKNLNDLTVNPLLEKAAEMKAKDMIAKGYFAHQSPDGHAPWYWLDKVGYDFSYAGENLAINFNESSDVNQAWLNSPKHKENIMNGNFTEIGVAVVDGMYQGKMTSFVVQFFGRPATKVVVDKNTKIIPAISTEEKIKTMGSSTVLGASSQKIIYEGVEKNPLLSKNNTSKPFWRYFIPVWF